MPKLIFITATGTEIGKTYFTCESIKLLKSLNKSVAAIKPIITGIDHNNFKESDSAKILQVLNQKVSEENISAISPFQYIKPLSPDIAALYEDNKFINFGELISFTKEFINNHRDKDYIFIEGVGGVMAPINQKMTICNYLQEFKCECVIISGNYLGTISHTLTAIQTVRSNIDSNVKVFLNNYPNNNINILNEHKDSIENISNAKCYTIIDEIY